MFTLFLVWCGADHLERAVRRGYAKHRLLDHKLILVQHVGNTRGNLLDLSELGPERGSPCLLPFFFPSLRVEPKPL